MKNLRLVDFDEKDLKIIDIGKMRRDHKDVEEEKNWFGIIKDYLDRKVKSENISLVVLDSLTALYSLSRSENLRNEVFHFFNYLRELEVTSFLITESSGNNAGSPSGVEDFLSDGLINLGYIESDGKVEWRIRCVKLRNSNHSPDYFMLSNTNGVFTATPENGFAANKDL